MKDTVILLGDKCVDETYIVDTSRKNPENPDQNIWKILTVYRKNGMAGNVEYGLNALGLQVDFLSVSPSSYDDTTTKIRYVDSITKTLLNRVDRDVPFNMSADGLYYLINKLSKYKYDSIGAVVICDYNKGVVTEKLLRLIDVLVPEDIPIFLDSKRNDLYKFERFKIKINNHEAEAQKKPLPSGTVVTLGADGAYQTGTKPLKYYHAPKVNVVDVCGAGDAFLAGYVYGHLKGNVDPIIYGICAGSLSVQHNGCYNPTLKELLHSVYDYHHYKEIK